MKALWLQFQGNPVLMRRINGWFTVFWIVMVPVSWFFGWLQSVSFVSALSLWALVSGHLSAWSSARVEVVQKEEKKEREQEDLPGDIIDRMVENTDVVRSLGDEEV